MSETEEQTRQDKLRADLLILAQARIAAHQRYMLMGEQLAELIITAADNGITKYEMWKITKVTPATIERWFARGD